MKRLATLWLALLLAFAGRAHAQVAPDAQWPPPSAADTERPPPQVARRTDSAPGWYGWQTLTVDLAGVLLGVASNSAFELRPPSSGVIAASWYGAGVVFAPAVHYAHHDRASGLTSLGMRLLAPPIAGGFGVLISCVSGHDFGAHCACCPARSGIAQPAAAPAIA